MNGRESRGAEGSALADFARRELLRNLLLLESIYTTFKDQDPENDSVVSERAGPCASYIVTWWRSHAVKLDQGVATNILFEVARLMPPELMLETARMESYGVTDPLPEVLMEASRRPIAGNRKRDLISRWLPPPKPKSTPCDLVEETLRAAPNLLAAGEIHAFAYLVGRAAGVAHSVGMRQLFDELSDAYETRHGLENLNLDVWLGELEQIEERSYRKGWGGWDEPFVAIREAIAAYESSDEARYHLMMGVVTGIMFSDPGPEYEFGTILDKIKGGYANSNLNDIKLASMRLAAGIRLSDPAPFLGRENALKHYRERDVACRLVQNFGLHSARADDDRVRVEGLTALNRAISEGRISTEDLRPKPGDQR